MKHVTSVKGSVKSEIYCDLIGNVRIFVALEDGYFTRILKKFCRGPSVISFLQTFKYFSCV